MSERGLERNYVAAQTEAEEEARARAPSPCLRGHETRKGGEIRKKENICSGSDSLPPRGGDTETTDQSALLHIRSNKCCKILFFK